MHSVSLFLEYLGRLGEVRGELLFRGEHLLGPTGAAYTHRPRGEGTEGDTVLPVGSLRPGASRDALLLAQTHLENVVHKFW